MTSKDSCTEPPIIYKATLNWIIEDFPIRGVSGSKRYIQSKPFWPNGKEATKMHLRIFPYGKEEENENVIIAELCSRRPLDYEEIRLKICFKNRSKSESYEYISTLYRLVIGLRHVVLQPISKDVTINCEVELVQKIGSNKQRTNLIDLLSSNMISMKCDGQSISAHAEVLKAMSPVLTTMLTTDMLEKKSKEIAIADISFKVLSELVAYFYSSSVPDYSEDVIELLKAADKYDVRCLINELEELLIDNISFDNFIYFLKTSEQFNLERLKLGVIEYMESRKED